MAHETYPCRTLRSSTEVSFIDQRRSLQTTEFNAMLSVVIDILFVEFIEYEQIPVSIITAHLVTVCHNEQSNDQSCVSFIVPEMAAITIDEYMAIAISDHIVTSTEHDS
jgi:hypothetical protein